MDEPAVQNCQSSPFKTPMTMQSSSEVEVVGAPGMLDRTQRKGIKLMVLTGAQPGES
jgi:hypothetical protein